MFGGLPLRRFSPPNTNKVAGDVRIFGVGMYATDVDVAIPSPICDLAHQRATIKKPQSCILRKEREKVKKHRRAVEAHGFDFKPFVISTFDGTGNGARKIIGVLAKHIAAGSLNATAPITQALSAYIGNILAREIALTISNCMGEVNKQLLDSRPHF